MSNGQMSPWGALVYHPTAFFIYTSNEELYFSLIFLEIVFFCFTGNLLIEDVILLFFNELFDGCFCEGSEICDWGFFNRLSIYKSFFGLLGPLVFG
jgi:hypothetical protein